MANNNYSKIRTIVGVITLIVMIAIALSGIFNKFVLARIWSNEKDINQLKIAVAGIEDIKENVKWLRDKFSK